MKVDLSGQVWAQFEQAQTRAKHHLDEGRSEEAAAEYRRCANLLRQYSQYAIDASVRKQRLERAEKFDQLAARIQSGLMGQAVSESSALDDYRETVRGLVTKTDVGWDEIGGLEETKREIQTAYALALARKPEGVFQNLEQ